MPPTFLSVGAPAPFPGRSALAAANSTASSNFLVSPHSIAVPSSQYLFWPHRNLYTEEDIDSIQTISSPYLTGQTPRFHAIETLWRHGGSDRAIRMLCPCQELCTNHQIYLSIIKDCIQRKALHLARLVHSHLWPHKAKLPGFLNDYVVVALAKCGGIEDAYAAALSLNRRTVFSWTAIISACTDAGRSYEALQLYRLMKEDGIQPDHYTIVSVLKACGNVGDLEQGINLHIEARKCGLLSDIFVSNTIMSMYGKCGKVEKAENVFCGLTQHNEISCNVMLSVYAENGRGGKALRLYRQMKEEKLCCDSLTLAISIQGCVTLAEKEEASHCVKVMALEIGRALHYDAQICGFGSDNFVGNMLVSLYGKFGTAAEAEKTFSNLSFQDIKTWTTMFCAYVDQGQGDRALQFYIQMHENGIRPDAHMFVTAFHACSSLAGKGESGSSIKQICLEIGLALHEDACKEGLTSDVFINTALLTLYWKCGKLIEAERVFSNLSQRSIVSWTAMLSAYVEHCQHAKALYLYQKMQEECVTLDDVTLVCVLQACSETGNLEICENLHFAIVSVGDYGQKLSLPSTLVHAYCSCSSMGDALTIFDGLNQPDVVSWGACIAGYAAKGNSIEGLRMFETMEQEGTRPNEVSFASVLSACSHSGLVCESIGYFDSMMSVYCIPRNLKHYVNMFDLLGRAGDFKRLGNVLDNMPMEADVTVWLCILGMCLKHGEADLGKKAFCNAVNLQPSETVAYILMSNIYAEMNLQQLASY